MLKKKEKMASEVEHLHYTYNDIHKLIERSAAEIEKTFKPTIFIAIGMPSFDFVHNVY